MKSDTKEQKMIWTKRALIVVLFVSACNATVERELDGSNARNHPGIVIIDPDTPYRAAVWAQEAYEARLKLDPVQNARVRDMIGERRRMELRSHEIEVQAAALVYDVDPVTYRAREAASMRRGYGGLFSRMTEAEIVTAMGAYTERAAKWVRENERDIRRQM